MSTRPRMAILRLKPLGAAIEAALSRTRRRIAVGAATDSRAA
jgi:hypothetical protein